MEFHVYLVWERSGAIGFFAVVESWHDSADTPSVIASTPPDYQVFERARPRTTRDAASISSNLGGICVFLRPGIVVSTPDFPQFESFELLSLFVRVNSLSFVSVVIYRPSPASAVNDRFFDDFADVLERTSFYARCIIVGDINVHIDDD